MGVDGDKRLFLSSGKIIKDYSLLIKYFEVCKQKGLSCEELIPSSNILIELRNLVEQLGSLRMDYVVQYLRSKIDNKLDCNTAIQAFRELYGLSSECEDVLKMLLNQLAGWYMEILDSLGYIKIKYSWRLD